MIKSKTRSMKAVAVVAMGFFIAGIGVTAASADQPDFICDAYDSGKINTTGDPATVEVTAPEGKLISGYCVKAGTEKFFVEVDPPQKTVVVDHPTKDSVSHYALQYVDEPVELTEATPTAPTVDPICGANNDTVTIPTTEGVDYSDTGWVGGERTVTATAKEGFTLVGDAEWTFTDLATTCPFEITGVSVTVDDPPICGPNNDTVNVPEVEGVTFDDTGWVDGERTITATADEGYVLDGQSEWTFTDVPGAACADEPPAFSYTPPTELAYTGASTTTNGLAALAAFLLASGTALVTWRTRLAG